MEEEIKEQQEPMQAKKPKSSGNRNFRKHNMLGFYRLMDKKKKSKAKKSKENPERK